MNVLTPDNLLTAAAMAAALAAAALAFAQARRAAALASRLKSVRLDLKRARRGSLLADAAEREDARRARVTTEVRRSAANGKWYWVLRLDGKTVATRQAPPHGRREDAEAEAAEVAPPPAGA